jgi:hypothetical protein
MTAKQLQVIHEVLWAAKETIQLLACDDYPYGEFKDEELCKMYFTLNEMCIKVTNKQARLQK